MGAYNYKPRPYGGGDDRLDGARHYKQGDLYGGRGKRPVRPYVSTRPVVRLPDYGTAVDKFVHADYNAEGTGGTAELAIFYQVLDSLPEKQISAILDKNMDAKFAKQAADHYWPGWKEQAAIIGVTALLALPFLVALIFLFHWITS
jgi:hypothetical protein